MFSVILRRGMCEKCECVVSQKLLDLYEKKECIDV